MLTEQLIENYTPVGDTIILVCCGMLLFLISKVMCFSKDKKFLIMKAALWFILLGAMMNVAFEHAVKFAASDWVLYVLRDVYHLCLALSLYCFVVYMKEMLGVKGKYVTMASVFTRALLAVSIICDIAAPLTGFGFHKEDGLWYDPVLSPYVMFYVYAVVAFTVMLVFYAERLIKPVRLCLGVAEILVVEIMIYQAIVNINSYTTFTYLLPVLIVMITLHSKPFDDKTGALSSDSFESFVKIAVEKNMAVDYMVLQLRLNVLEKMPDELGKVLNSFWHKHFRNAFLFNPDNDLFVLAIPRDGKNENNEEKIEELTKAAFHKEYATYKIPYKVIGLFGIDFIENETDIIGMIKYLLKGMEENSVELVTDEKRKNLELFKAIRENLADIEKNDNLDDERVLVYCQPIKNTETGAFDTAEALMRMSIPESSFVRPDFFIPMAEEYGHIHALSRIMLNKVCKEIKRLEDEGYNFKRISVNFTASEIQDDKFCGEILEIVNMNGISPSKIGIELTETQTESDFQVARNKIAILRDAGMTVYLDDVGTGYSNIDRIVKYDVDVVKFDRFFLLEAEKDPRKLKMMRHLSQAFRDLNYELLYEGLETEDHEKICELCGADYYQGFRFAKPQPIQQMREYFEKKNNV